MPQDTSPKKSPNQDTNPNSNPNQIGPMTTYDTNTNESIDHVYRIRKNIKEFNSKYHHSLCNSIYSTFGTVFSTFLSGVFFKDSLYGLIDYANIKESASPEVLESLSNSINNNSTLGFAGLGFSAVFAAHAIYNHLKANNDHDKIVSLEHEIDCIKYSKTRETKVYSEVDSYLDNYAKIMACSDGVSTIGISERNRKSIKRLLKSKKDDAIKILDYIENKT